MFKTVLWGRGGVSRAGRGRVVGTGTGVATAGRLSSSPSGPCPLPATVPSRKFQQPKVSSGHIPWAPAPVENCWVRPHAEPPIRRELQGRYCHSEPDLDIALQFGISSLREPCTQ